MTKDEFINKYHDYMTQDESEAKAEAARVNAIGVDGEAILAVAFSGTWCLMLARAYASTIEMGIESKT